MDTLVDVYFLQYGLISTFFLFLIDDTDDAKPKLPEVKSAPKQRSSVAAEKRKKIMEQMAKQQKNFLQKHKNELENIVSSPTSSSPR